MLAKGHGDEIAEGFDWTRRPLTILIILLVTLPSDLTILLLSLKFRRGHRVPLCPGEASRLEAEEATRRAEEEAARQADEAARQAEEEARKAQQVEDAQAAEMQGEGPVGGELPSTTEDQAGEAQEIERVGGC